MASIIGHTIDYNGVGALRGQRHIPSKNNLSTLPAPHPPPTLAFVWVKNQAVPKTLMTDDTVVDTLVEAEMNLVAVTIVRAEVKTPLAT